MIKDIIGVLLDPPYWVRNRHIDHVWSDRLEKTIDGIYTERIHVLHYDEYSIEFNNGVHVWIKNYPYDFGYEYHNPLCGLPKRRVAEKLCEFVGYINDKRAI